MKLRALLRKRFHLRIDLIDPELHTIQAAAEPGGVGSWFSANFGVGNLLAVMGLAGTLIGGYASLRSNDAQTSTQLANIDRRVDSLNERFRTQVVSRDEYAGNNVAIAARFGNVETNQTQLVGHMIGGCH